MNDFITEEEVQQLESDGKLVPLSETRPITPSENALRQTPMAERYLSGATSPSIQYQPDLIKTDFTTVPSVRIMPPPPSGLAIHNSMATNNASSQIQTSVGSKVVSLQNNLLVQKSTTGVSIVTANNPVTLDQVQNGVIYSRPRVAVLNTNGNLSPVEVSNQISGIPQTVTVFSHTTSVGSVGWVQAGSATFQIGVGTNTIAFNLTNGSSGSGIYDMDISGPDNIGFAIISSGSPPASPQATGHIPGISGTVLVTLNTPPTGSVTIYGYILAASGGSSASLGVICQANFIQVIAPAFVS